MKRIVITGSAGLVGMNLLTRLDPEKYEVFAIDKNANNIRLSREIFPEVKSIVADVSEKGEWEELFEGADCVIQLQAQISDVKKRPYIKNNITSVRKVLKACRKHEVKNLIHISSSVVISVADDEYTRTKRKGEEMVKDSGIPHTILRPPLMYGCFDIKHLGFITEILEKYPILPIPGSGKYPRQPLFVLDLCDIIIKLIKGKPKNKVYNVIGKEEIYFIDLFRVIADIKGIKRVLLPIPTKLFLLMLKMYSIVTGKNPFVSEQLNALQNCDVFPVTDWEIKFDVRYTPFREGIKKMVTSDFYIYRKKMRKFEEI